MANERALAESTSDQDLLRKLANSKDPGIRFEVANNPNTPIEVLSELALDQIGSVANAAMQRLGGDVPEKVNCFLSTLQLDPNQVIKKQLGIVYGTSSKMALGLNKQSTRINLATDAALEDLKQSAARLGGNAVIGVQLALNSSQGAAAIAGGSSEAVIAYGTAVILDSNSDLNP